MEKIDPVGPAECDFSRMEKIDPVGPAECDFSRMEKIEMFLSLHPYYTQSRITKNTTMANIRNQDENGINEYERVTHEWNQSAEVRSRRTQRINEINNTPEYYTGNRIHHLRTIQVPSFEVWNELFRYEALDPVLREYVQASIRYAENGGLFAGQMEVSLILQENYRPGIHVAIFIIQLSPHRQFYDGHVIQREFGDGSVTHQAITRMFNTDDHAVVSQATEYEILQYIAHGDDMRYLLDRCFMDPDFTTVQYIYIMPPPPGYNEEENNNGHYVVDYHGGNDHQHQVHDFEAAAALPDADADAAADAAVIVVPPPPQVINNFQEVYNYNFNNIPYYEDDDNSDDDDDDDDSEYDDENADVRG